MYPREERLESTKSGTPFTMIPTRTEFYGILQGCKIHEYLFCDRLFPSLTGGRQDSHILPRVPGPMERGESKCNCDWLWEGDDGFVQRKADPIITVYEAQANPADHEKIQGMVGGAQMSQP